MIGGLSCHRKCSLVVNDAPYGTEKAYNALRLAIALQAKGASVRVFLMADAVYCGLPGQQTPPGYYNIEEMLGRVHLEGRAGGRVRQLHEGQGIVPGGDGQGRRAGLHGPAVRLDGAVPEDPLLLKAGTDRRSLPFEESIYAIERIRSFEGRCTR